MLKDQEQAQEQTLFAACCDVSNNNDNHMLLIFCIKNHSYRSQVFCDLMSEDLLIGQKQGVNF